VAPPLPPKTSQLLADLRDAFPGDEPISVRDVLKRLEGRGFGLLLLLLALPNCIPNLPGVSTVFGVLLVAPAIQMIFGAGSPWIPKQIADMKAAPETFRKAIDWAMPMLVQVEKLVQPRLQFLTEKPATIWFGIQILILAGLLSLPIPGVNMIPSFGVAFYAIALLQRDGLFAIVSFGLFVISCLLGPVMIGAGLAGLDYIVQTVSGWLGVFGR
jgi:hypothetical protein